VLNSAEGKSEQGGELVLAAHRLSLAHGVIYESLAAAEVCGAQYGVDALVMSSDLAGSALSNPVPPVRSLCAPDTTLGE